VIEFRDNATRDLLWRGTIVPDENHTLEWTDPGGVERIYEYNGVTHKFVSPVPVGEMSNTDCGVVTIVYVTQQ